MTDRADPVAAYITPGQAEAHVRATLDRPDQVHVIPPEVLRALLDQLRGYRILLGVDDQPEVLQTQRR